MFASLASFASNLSGIRTHSHVHILPYQLLILIPSIRHIHRLHDTASNLTFVHPILFPDSYLFLRPIFFDSSCCFTHLDCLYFPSFFSPFSLFFAPCLCSMACTLCRTKKISLCSLYEAISVVHTIGAIIRLCLVAQPPPTTFIAEFGSGDTVP
jgi:hypothetical protein